MPSEFCSGETKLEDTLKGEVDDRSSTLPISTGLVLTHLYYLPVYS